ncbi:hypothetical protein HPB47_026802 [Ixodes persulcatus]|uniref:Uncharacterized protein n=1 Tax=Ixodes persulcatus TaxID=34615 RepID=A0AC60PY63_IXOPE|nr:hypothetical protein HPB47_026802 [Ixodes persulcatus]
MRRDGATDVGLEIFDHSKRITTPCHTPDRMRRAPDWSEAFSRPPVTMGKVATARTKSAFQLGEIAPLDEAKRCGGKAAVEIAAASLPPGSPPPYHGSSATRVLTRAADVLPRKARRVVWLAVFRCGQVERRRRWRRRRVEAHRRSAIQSTDEDLELRSFRRTMTAASQVVIGLVGVVFSLGLVAFIVSYYKMGARSWSERRSRPAPHDPQPYQHVLLPPVQSALYTSASVAERQRAALAAAHDAQVRAASVRTDLALELPPTVALPEEHPLTMSVHLRDADQEQELYGACVRAPPNRTVTDSCPPCRSGSLSLVQRNCATPLVMRSHSVSVAQCRRTAPWPSSAGSTDCGRPGGV